MNKIKRIVAVTLFLILLPVAQVFSDSSKPSRSYDDLLNVYLNRSALLPKVRELEASLLADAENLEPVQLWRTIRNFSNPARIRAANGLALVRDIFPGGDPGKWDEISGFWLPQAVSKPLAAFDAIYYTSIALLDLDEDAAPWLAQGLLEDLRRSSRGALLALRTAPGEYPQLIFRLESETGLAPIGGWPDADISGILPFAHAASSFVMEEHALMRGMVFLNASGQPVSGTGPYAWDRMKGRVYRVVESRDDIYWWRLFRK